jgi:hypothetical protein
MSDLQCPATVLLVPSEIVDSEECRRALAGRRILGFFVDAAAVNEPEGAAAISGLAGASDCPVEGIGPLVDAASFTRALEELADLYRGQCVVVVATARLIQARLGAGRTPIALFEVEIDSDGWVVKA